MHRSLSAFQQLLTACLLATCIFSFSSNAKAQVIPNDAILIPGGFGADYSLQLTQQMGGLFAFGFNELGGGDVFVGAQGIAQPIGLWEIDFMDVFDTNYAISNPRFADNSGQTAGTFNVQEGESFYLAYWDDTSFLGINVPDPTDSFGWAEITRTNGDLEIVGSATAIGGGIVVGTLQQVPEPSAAFALTILATSCFVRRRRSA